MKLIYQTLPFILIITIYLDYVSTSESVSEVENKKVVYKQCPKFNEYNDETGKCEHKGFFPIYPEELVELIVFTVTSMVATSVGVGGGGIYSSVLMFVEGFKPSEAYPISTFLIATCSISTLLMGIIDKSEHPTNLFICWDLAMIFCPTMLLGTKIGTILNKSLSNIFLTIFLAAFIFSTVLKTYKNAKKQSEKELTSCENLKKIEMREDFNSVQSMKESFLVPSTKSSSKYQRSNEEKERLKRTNDFINKTKEEANKPLRWGRLKYLLLFLLISMVDQLIEGNSKIPSLIGLERCSLPYWFVFFAFIGITIYLVKFSFDIAREDYEKKVSASKDFKSPHFEILQDNMLKIISLTFLGGIIAGMLGIGGGMITTPLLLSLGLDPKAATSTSNFLITFTSFTGTILFIFSGQLHIIFAISFAIPCGLAALYGSRLINEHINRTKRSSILLYFLFYTLLASFIVLLITSFNRLTEVVHSGEGITVFQANHYCNN